MKGEKTLQILATRIGQLELDKAILLAQLEELGKTVEALQKEVEKNGTN